MNNQFPRLQFKIIYFVNSSASQIRIHHLSYISPNQTSIRCTYHLPRYFLQTIISRLVICSISSSERHLTTQYRKYRPHNLNSKSDFESKSDTLPCYIVFSDTTNRISRRSKSPSYVT